VETRILCGDLLTSRSELRGYRKRCLHVYRGRVVAHCIANSSGRRGKVAFGFLQFLNNLTFVKLSGCDLLLMDTVNVSSRVRTIEYRMYRTPVPPVRYSIHYLCNVNNTPLRIRDVASH